MSRIKKCENCNLEIELEVGSFLGGSNVGGMLSARIIWRCPQCGHENEYRRYLWYEPIDGKMVRFEPEEEAR